MAKSRGHALRDYIIRRLLLMIPTFIGITLVTFLLCQFVPGGPIDQLKLQLAGRAGEAGAGGGGREILQFNIPEDQLAVLKSYYGFDKPIVPRYFAWLGKIASMDLGDSYRFSEPVIAIIKDRLPVSLYYGILTAIFTYGICVPLGMLKAVKHRTLLDNSTSALIFIGYAIPGFALGAVLLVLLSVKLHWFPLGGFHGEDFAALSSWGQVKDVVWHSVLPLVSYLIGSFAVMTMLMKNSLMENMSADYVVTALAKGLTWRRAIFGHALRNSLIPMATSFGNLIAIIMTGSLLIERVFNIRGIGLLTFEAIQARDYPIVLESS